MHTPPPLTFLAHAFGMHASRMRSDSNLSMDRNCKDYSIQLTEVIVEIFADSDSNKREKTKVLIAICSGCQATMKCENTAVGYTGLQTPFDDLAPPVPVNQSVVITQAES